MADLQRLRYTASVAREQFFQPAAESLFKKLEHLSHRSGVSRGVAFEDWLNAMVCALAAETKEAEYLAMIERHKAGKPGKRGCDLMGEMVGELVAAMRPMAKASNRSSAGDVQDLAVAVEQLAEESRLLRMALDELRDDVV